MFFCPLPAELTAIPIANCLLDFGQWQKIAIQRLRKEDGTVNEIDIATTDPKLLATWAALKAATDNTKVVVSPLIEAVESTPGEKREFGGGNATVGGQVRILGSNPSTMQGMIRSKRQDVIAAMKTYGHDNVGIFAINEYGQIGGIVDDQETPTKFSPIPIQSFFIGDLKFGGYEAPDENAISWSYAANFSDGFQAITPTDFKSNLDL